MPPPEWKIWQVLLPFFTPADSTGFRRKDVGHNKDLPLCSLQISLVIPQHRTVHAFTLPIDNPIPHIQQTVPMTC